jgi:chemotaxis protein MotB
LKDTLRKEFERYKASHQFTNTEVVSVKSELADMEGQLTTYINTHESSDVEITDRKRSLIEIEQTLSTYRNTHHLSDREADDLKLKLVNLENRAKLDQQVLSHTEALLAELSSIDGILTLQIGKRGVLKFSHGLFLDRLDRITPSGQRTLDKIINILDRQEEPFLILVEGHTDNHPIARGTNRWYDNWSLGLFRANIVLVYLRNNLKTKQMRLACCSVGSSNPPFPNDDLSKGRKNRTVVLHFVPGSL